MEALVDNSAPVLLRKLRSSLLLTEDWGIPPADQRSPDLDQYTDAEALLNALIQQRLLTPYQVDRIKDGKLADLVVGNYRIVEQLGAGLHSTVLKGEHLHLRHSVAIKVMALPADVAALSRILAQVRAVARLQHPHIAEVIDAGEVAGTAPAQTRRWYSVTRFIPGHDLRELLASRGPLTLAQACAAIYQIADALAAAHAQRLFHGRVKPANVRLAPDGQAMLMDFAVTDLDSDTPEVLRRKDMIGLGETLFCALTGRPPYSHQPGGGAGSPKPPSTFRPDIPHELDRLVSDLLAPAAALDLEAVMRSLTPFVPARSAAECGPSASASRPESSTKPIPADLAPTPTQVALEPGRRVLIVDDEPAIRHFCRLALQAEGLLCDEAANGVRALEAFKKQHYDLVLLDIDMPEMSGLEACRRLRENPPQAHLKVIMFSGRSSPDDLAQLLLTGADDYLMKPFTPMQLQARVQAALRLKAAQQRSDLLNHDLLVVNRELEQHLNARTGDLVQARNALVLALAKLVEYRDSETGAHLLRIQHFSRRLAEEARHMPPFTAQLDDNFIHMLVCCAPLHDIGKVGLPDHILLKPSKLDPDERSLMQAHTTIGADTLAQVARQHGFALAFLQMSIDITRHHHERYDGHGYPDRLAQSDIPLAARLVTICDVYDALRSRRVYKPALPHATAVQLMEDSSGGQFDPALFQAFRRCAPDFDRIYGDLSD
jgi:response regulator RpfG family c-di-GMP phosphodiesterase